MNCKDFESVVLALDRGEGPGVPAQEHAAACSCCSQKLEVIAELRESLAAVARQDARLEAPAHIEAALLRGLSERQAPVKAGFAPRLIARPRLTLALAAAAVIALVGIAASIIYTRSSATLPRETAHRSPQPAAPGKQREDKARELVPPAPKKEDPVSPNRERSLLNNRIATSRERDSKAARMGVEKVATNRDAPDSYEIATDYFPISYASYLQPLDSGQIVRIKLPRSALRSYGLPVDPLRADEPVKADVVIGNDGMARAIRFVH